MIDTADQRCIAVSDLHGSVPRYRRLIRLIAEERPDAVFIGGDLLPRFGQESDSGHGRTGDFVRGFLAGQLSDLRVRLKEQYPRVFLILGNDDPRSHEIEVADSRYSQLWEYMHNRHAALGDFQVYGYSYVPPTPFLLKDWERYDVSRFVDPGCVSPEDGAYTVAVPERVKKYATIQDDLTKLTGDTDLSRSIFLFHTPPYKTNLDRAALDGRLVDHVPMDVHVGSIAVRRMIEDRQPHLTLHGHIHESARLTGNWRDRIGRTHLLTAAHDSPGLAVIRFALGDPESAHREILTAD